MVSLFLGFEFLFFKYRYFFFLLENRLLENISKIPSMSRTSKNLGVTFYPSRCFLFDPHSISFEKMRTSNFYLYCPFTLPVLLPFELGFVYPLVATCLKRNLSFPHSFLPLFGGSFVLISIGFTVSIASFLLRSFFQRHNNRLNIFRRLYFFCIFCCDYLYFRDSHTILFLKLFFLLFSFW